ncbi:MAG: V4R domain-containing protein [Gemmatimonadota bacterium]
MRGIAFGLLKESLREELDGTEWERLLGGGAASAADSGGNELGQVSDLPSDALLCWLGRQAVSRMAVRFPSLFAIHPDFSTFLHSLEDSLAAGWLESDRDGVAPSLAVRDTLGGRSYLTLRQGGHACALLKGFVTGAAELFGRSVDLREVKCSHHGDNACVILVEQLGTAAAAGDEPRVRVGSGRGRAV